MTIGENTNKNSNGSDAERSMARDCSSTQSLMAKIELLEQEIALLKEVIANKQRPPVVGCPQYPFKKIRVIGEPVE